MKIPFLAAGFVLSATIAALSQPCAENAKVVKPSLSGATAKTYEAKLEEARQQFEKTPNDADAIIWLGRRTAYLGNYKEAIKIFTQGIAKHPIDARFYRHRGHRHITLRCFDEAIIDLERAAELIKGKPDEVEPDGLPNAKNIPTSTLESNIWYHLGLAYYLTRQFERASGAYSEAAKVSKTPDMLVATKHWQYMTLRRWGNKNDAKRAVANIADDLEIIENDDYYKLVKLYRGKLNADDLLKQIGADSKTLGNASLGYGLGYWFFYNGDRIRAMDIFRRITAGNQWASFGFIAAEAELGRAK